MTYKQFILDATCGGRMIWFNKKHPNALYMDCRRLDKGEYKVRPNFTVDPDIIGDFRDIDFPDASFKLVVWDPPHVARKLSNKSWVKQKYGMLHPTEWPKDLSVGFRECWRVLEPYGVLIFKWSEPEISLKEILALFPVEPLFGHTTGSKSTTHWLCFMKIPGPLGSPATPPNPRNGSLGKDSGTFNSTIAPVESVSTKT